MKHALSAMLLLGLLSAGCHQYIVKVRLFDVKGKPVMDAAIAVEGEYITGYKDKARKEPILEKFSAMDEFTDGTFAFGVWGLPDTFRFSADAPGFYKCIISARRYPLPDGGLVYRVTDASPGYSTNSARYNKKGHNIFIDVFLVQSSTRRSGSGGWTPGGQWRP